MGSSALCAEQGSGSNDHSPLLAHGVLCTGFAEQLLGGGIVLVRRAATSHRAWRVSGVKCPELKPLCGDHLKGRKVSGLCV